MKSILFVCSGNTCRSPIAEGIARKVFSEAGVTYRASSAGSSALDGSPASSTAVEVAAAHSIDLSPHRARLLNTRLVREADLIVTMGASHRETVGIIEPTALGHTYLLTDFCDEEEGDVPDPIGMGRAAYERTYALIEKCIVAMIDSLASFDGWKRDSQPE